MYLSQVIAILRARAWLIFIVLITVIATTVALTLATPKKYSATTSVVIDFKTSEPLNPLAGSSVQLSPSYMATQMDIIGSRKVAARVVTNLKLTESAAVQTMFQTDTQGRGNIVDWLAERMLRDLVVTPQHESRVVNITFSGTDPRFAAAVADAFAYAYIDTALDLNIEPARRNVVWFDEQLKNLRIRMEQAQRAATDYQQDRGITETNERLDTEVKRLTDLATQYLSAQAQVYEAESRQLGNKHPAYLAALSREQALRAAHDAQKRRVLALKRERDEVGMLLREAESAQRIYDAALQRYNQTSLESQVTQTNIAVLNKAVVPTTASSPKPLRNLLVALLLAPLLGVGLAVGIEVVDRRVRSVEQLMQEFSLPTLGVVRPAQS